jgi:hypothetical protein
LFGNNSKPEQANKDYTPGLPKEEAEDGDEKKEYWTTQKLVDELFLCLIDFRDSVNNDLRKYEDQAKYLIYRIPIYRPTPSFLITKKDLTDRLIQELESLDQNSKKNIMKEAVDRIFEGINKRYYLLSVRNLLNVELIE